MMSMNTKERENASTAETLPLDKAVNMPLMKMLKPMKNRAIVHTRFPVTASSYTGCSGDAKKPTSDIGSPSGHMNRAIQHRNDFISA